MRGRPRLAFWSDPHETHDPASYRYKEAGPAGVAAFEAGVAGQEARAFRGCGIFTSEPFEVSDDQDSVQMCVLAMRRRARARPCAHASFLLRRLTRSSQIGEFYIMQPPQVAPPNSKFTCDMLLYDEESDRHVRITWLEALKASGVGELVANNPTRANTDAMALAGPPTGSNSLFKWFGDALYWAAYSADTDLWVNDNGKILTTDPGGLSGFAINSAGKYTGGKIPKPTAYDITKVNCRLVVARPFIEHLMHSVILTVSGRDTGATRAILPPTPIRDCCSLWRIACTQSSARRTCSSQRTRRSRPSKDTTPATLRP